jgi:hypothetical protein
LEVWEVEKVVGRGKGRTMDKNDVGLGTTRKKTKKMDGGRKLRHNTNGMQWKKANK